METDLDGSIESLGDGDHHRRPENPKDVVEEQSAEQRSARSEAIKLEDLDGTLGETEAKHVRQIPRFIEVNVQRGQSDREGKEKESREGEGLVQDLTNTRGDAEVVGCRLAGQDTEDIRSDDAA